MYTPWMYTPLTYKVLIFFFEILISDGQMFFFQTKPPSFTASLLQTHLIWSERQIELSHWGTELCRRRLAKRAILSWFGRKLFQSHPSYEYFPPIPAICKYGTVKGRFRGWVPLSLSQSRFCWSCEILNEYEARTIKVYLLLFTFSFI